MLKFRLAIKIKLKYALIFDLGLIRYFIPTIFLILCFQTCSFCQNSSKDIFILSPPILSESQLSTIDENEIEFYKLNLPSRYVYRKVLGRGIQATVYLTYDNTSHSLVALKTTGIDSEKGILISEFSIIQKLKGVEGVVEILDFGGLQERDASTPYYTMRYTEGVKEVNVYCENLNFIDKLKIFRKILSTVCIIHSKNIIHRDLKAGNLLVDPNGNSYIIDWGIARQTQTDNDSISLIDKSSDLIFFGATIRKIIFGTSPRDKYMSKHVAQLHEMIRKTQFGYSAEQLLIDLDGLINDIEHTPYGFDENKKLVYLPNGKYFSMVSTGPLEEDRTQTDSITYLARDMNRPDNPLVAIRGSKQTFDQTEINILNYQIEKFKSVNYPQNISMCGNPQEQIYLIMDIPTDINPITTVISPDFDTVSFDPQIGLGYRLWVLQRVVDCLVDFDDKELESDLNMLELTLGTIQRTDFIIDPTQMQIIELFPMIKKQTSRTSFRKQLRFFLKNLATQLLKDKTTLLELKESELPYEFKINFNQLLERIENSGYTSLEILSAEIRDLRERNTAIENLRINTINAYKAGDYEEALKILDNIVFVWNVHSSKYYRLRALINDQHLNRSSDAVKDYKRYIQARSLEDKIFHKETNIEPQIYQNLACALYRSSAYSESIRYFTKLIDIDPQNALAYYGRGLSTIEIPHSIKIYASAFNDFYHALSISQDNTLKSSIHKSIGELLASSPYSTDDTQKAILHYSEAIKLNPNNAEAYSLRGKLYFNKKEFALALIDMKKAQDLGYTVDQTMLKNIENIVRRDVFYIQQNKQTISITTEYINTINCCI